MTGSGLLIPSSSSREGLESCTTSKREFLSFHALLPTGILQEAGKAEGVQQPQSLSAWKARPQRGFAHLVGPAPDTYIITSRSASLIKHQAPRRHYALRPLLFPLPR